MTEQQPKPNTEPFKTSFEYATLGSTVDQKFQSPSEAPDTILRINKNEQNVSPEQRAQHYKEYLDKLAELGIDHIPFNPFIAQRNRDADSQIYNLTEKFNGGDLHDVIERIPPQVIIELIDKITSFYEQIIARGGSYDHDLKLSQFMYGHTSADTADKLVLIDLEPDLLRTFSLPPTTEQLDDMKWALRKFILTIHEIDDKVEIPQEALDRLSKLTMQLDAIHTTRE